ncbi:N-carbamoylsarcosine amidase (plasmid) [Azospirillum sp. TSH58]|uniref:Isochorismatase family protein n=1 Tax=Azospirillum brasilense TaxID=192 RepID=A0A4D8RF44_AZOBR|nr:MULTISPECIES: isochorismatase family protein [Azospirillum]AWJ85752.1 N-carbamoylsarcosine amidase [Azospirillum sp. TSH58]MBK3778379.1 isochorismatase family protein [Azospirillum brasilense]PWC73333.1 N-carbamoylsarcosine amidase [Azospirillum sp. TSH58]QCO19236.1 isochorismatase family protein [Azospirillum brasilense]
MSVSEQAVYERQGFGRSLGIQGQIGLLIVDFVNGFADPAVFGGGNIAPAIARTAQVLAKARQRGWFVAHSRIVYADDGSDGNVFSIKVPGMQTLTEHAAISAIVPELTPVPGELVVRKTVPSAFFGTGLAPWLTQRGVETLLIAGATTSGCVRASVVDAMCHGFRPVVMADCVGDRALAPHEANLFDIGQKYGDVVPAERVLAL